MKIEMLKEFIRHLPEARKQVVLEAMEKISSMLPSVSLQQAINSIQAILKKDFAAPPLTIVEAEYYLVPAYQAAQVEK